MQAKDREIALLQQQLGEKVSHELLINPLSIDYEYQWLWLCNNANILNSSLRGNRGIQFSA